MLLLIIRLLIEDLHHHWEINCLKRKGKDQRDRNTIKECFNQSKIQKVLIKVYNDIKALIVNEIRII